jgi:hypothetical protein
MAVIAHCTPREGGGMEKGSKQAFMGGCSTVSKNEKEEDCYFSLSSKFLRFSLVGFLLSFKKDVR